MRKLSTEHLCERRTSLQAAEWLVAASASDPAAAKTAAAEAVGAEALSAGAMGRCCAAAAVVSQGQIFEPCTSTRV